MKPGEIYNQIINLISRLSLEDKEALADDLANIIYDDIEQIPYVPDHNDEHRVTEAKALNERL